MWWMRRLGRVKLRGRAVVWGLVLFAGLVVLGHLDPNQGLAARAAHVAAMAEGHGGKPLVKQARHALHHVPHRVPWWMRPGYGGGGGGNQGSQGATSDMVADGILKLY